MTDYERWLKKIITSIVEENILQHDIAENLFQSILKIYKEQESNK